MFHHVRPFFPTRTSPHSPAVAAPPFTITGRASSRRLDWVSTEPARSPAPCAPVCVRLVALASKIAGMFRSGPGIVLLGALSWAAVPAAQGETERTPIDESAYQRINESLVHHHLLPRYRDLAAAMGNLHGAVASLCATPAPDALEHARSAFHGAMDAWMAVQHLPFGPLERELRIYRLYFWPQARGKVADALAGLLETDDAGVLSPDRFSGTSAAVQGLPAAEHLLFMHGDALGTGTEAARTQCRVLESVGRNLEEIAREALDEWGAVTGTGGGSRSYADLVLGPGPENREFSTAKDATLLFFSALHDELALIADVKVGPVVRDTLESARPAFAESRPSRRATRNLEINLRALQALYAGESGPGLGELVSAHGGDEGLDPLMRKAFRLTLGNLRSIGVPLDEAVVDPGRRPQTEKLSLQVRAMRKLVRTRLAEALDLAVGFNAMDGD